MLISKAMDGIFKDMDIFRKITGNIKNDSMAFHLAQYPRETHHGFPVVSIGYIKRKTLHITRTFNTQNFSFILKGTGTYKDCGKTYKVEAPCVITQQPGIPVDYGPDLWWEELYLIYDKIAVKTLNRRGLLVPDKNIWQISNVNVLQEPLEMLINELNTLDHSRFIDRIDLLCEMLILASISNAYSVLMTSEESKVRDIESNIRKSILKSYDFNEIAQKCGMHPATFRRYWDRLFAFPPARYIMKLRMNEACRMLAETRLTVSQISYALKFDDPLYFSRKFRKEFGCTATEYRNRHQSILLYG
ncbi:MAG: AraC family transcriptional regulator [bacterium]